MPKGDWENQENNRFVAQLTPQLMAALQEYQEMTKAATVRLLLLSAPVSAPGCCAGEQATTDESSEPRRTVLSADCPRRLQGGVLGVAGSAGTVSKLHCTRCQLDSGETLALQLGFRNGSTIYSQDPIMATLSNHLLMWAKETLERALLQAESRNDLHMAIRAQEEEREWLALEVHDRIAQTLAAVFQQLQTLESLSRPLPEIRQAAVRGSVLCREAIREARYIMNDLHPPVLDELGLAPLVEEETRHFQEDTGCNVKVNIDYAVRPQREVEVALFRIFHEALINVRRHANAQDIVISLASVEDGVDLQVADNGVGFDVPRALQRKRVGGLISMQRRAELVAGTCQLGSKPGQGTTVSVWVPLAIDPQIVIGGWHQ